MKILSRLLGRPPAAPPVRPEAGPAEVGDEEAAPRGCGWFDSSHDLQCGLWVREHASPDEVAVDLPLAAWLDLHLAGWQTPLPA